MGNEKINKKEPKGLGGWLILLQIGLIGSCIKLVREIFSFISSSSLSGNETYDSIVLIGDSIILMLAAYTLILFYTKNKKFKMTAIFLLWFGVVLSLSGIIFLYIYYDNLALYLEEIKDAFSILFVSLFIDLALQITAATIWTLYLKKSRRVKNTFIN